MASITPISRITTLTGSGNYRLWKFQVQNHLRVKDALKVTLGEERKPVGGNTEIIKKWDEADAYAMSIIGDTVDPDIAIDLTDCVSAAAMWLKIAKKCDDQTGETIGSLIDAVQCLSMNDMSMEEYVKDARNKITKLKAAGEVITDKYAAAQVLRGLPETYKFYKVTWDNKREEEKTLEALWRGLQRADEREQESGSGSAFLAKGKEKQQQKVSTKNNQPKSKIPKKTKKECYFCGKPGHFKAECYHYKKDQNKEKKSTKDVAGTFVCQAEANVCKISDWIADSGASFHMVHDRSLFCELDENRGGEPIKLADDQKIISKGIGKIKLEAWRSGRWKKVTLEDVRWVPSLKKNLFAFNAAAKHGHKVITTKDEVTVMYKNLITAVGTWDGNLYQMKIRSKLSQVCTSEAISLQLLHERMGHASAETLKKMVKNKAVTGIELGDLDEFECEACEYGKQTRRAFPSTISRNLEVEDLVHTDVSGPHEPTYNGTRWFIVLKDDASEFRMVHIMKSKEEASSKVLDYCAYVRTHFRREVKFVKCDNGREFVNEKLKNALARNGTVLELTAPYNPEQNGKAEREIRTLTETARSMLHGRGLPKTLWGEAVKTATYLRNMTCTSKNSNQTPYERWFNKKPDLSNLEVFGSDCYENVPKIKRRKWDKRAEKRIFVGYQGSNNFRIYDPIKRKVGVATTVTFSRKQGDFRFSKVKSVTEVDSDPSGDPSEPNNVEETSEDGTDETTKQQSKRSGKVSSDKRELRDRSLLKKPDRYACAMVSANEPTTYAEAMEGPEAIKWEQAINEEIAAHKKNSTWKIDGQPEDRKPIDCKWVFKVKQTPGEEDRYKARLVARGFTQRVGIDYEETYAPVVRYESIRALLGKAASEDLEIKQFDVKTAFLHGELKENIWIELPEGPWPRNKRVVKLIKGLYGLKQSPNCWNKKFDEFLRSYELEKSSADNCIYISRKNHEELYLALYVDDGLALSTSTKVLDQFLEELRAKFEVKINEPRYFVGLEIERNRGKRSIKIYQTNYIQKVIDKFRMSDAKIASVPLDPTIKYSSNMCPKSTEEKAAMADKPYNELLGSLQFIANLTRPDIAYAINLLSRFKVNPGNQHWEGAKHIIRYLKGTKDQGIIYGGSRSENTNLLAYSDADWAGDQDDRKSTSGYIMMMYGGPISWASRKQECNALSTLESEYIATAAAVQEIKWLRQLIRSVNGQEYKIKLLVDNQGAIQFTKTTEFHRRTKHIDNKWNFVKDEVQDGTIELNYVSSKEQLADILTKSLNKGTLNVLKNQINISN